MFELRSKNSIHGGKSIGRGLLNKIIKQAGLSVKEFIKL